MQIEIYADMVFLINFFMDFFIFWIANKLMKKRAPFFRIVLGALSASIIYCLFIFITPLNIFYNILGVLFILSVSVFIAFFPKSLKEFFKMILIINVSAFAVGGVALGLFYYTNMSDFIGNMIGFTIENFSFKILIASSCFSYIFIKFLFSCFRRFLKKHQSFVNIIIENGENTALINALIDTGNSLHEPISNKPVIIAQFSAIKEFLPDEIKILYYENNENDLEKIYSGIKNSCLKFRFIPFSSVGRKEGFIIGFIADRVKILNSNEKNEIIIKSAVIGICNFDLSKDGFYSALLSPEML